MKRCSRCGKPFSCGKQDGAARCWCEDMPPKGLPAGPGADCLCPDCLKASSPSS